MAVVHAVAARPDVQRERVWAPHEVDRRVRLRGRHRERERLGQLGVLLRRALGVSQERVDNVQRGWHDWQPIAPLLSIEVVGNLAVGP